MRRMLTLVSVVLLFGCEGGKTAPIQADTAIPQDTLTASDTATPQDTQAVADTAAPQDTLTVSDTSVEEVIQDTSVSDSTAPDGEGPALVKCNSLFAAQVADLHYEMELTIPRDCDAPLTAPIGKLSKDTPLCDKGESANACRERLYHTPPSLTTLPAGSCAEEELGPNCLRARWVPKCVDGTDDGCSEPEAVCQDGTRPMVYMATAAEPSNDWTFHLGGEGEPCTALNCWINYRHKADIIYASTSMSSMHPKASTSPKAGPTKSSISGHGFSAGNKEFKNFNRVKWNRCSDVSSDKAVSTMAMDVCPEAEQLLAEGQDLIETGCLSPWAEVTVWHKGLNTWLSLFRSLTKDEQRDLDGDGKPDLPSLAQAKTVLIAGSSDASRWLVFAADRLREELIAIAGPDVDVRVIVDGYYEPMLDNEFRYSEGAPKDFSLVTTPYHKAVADGLVCTLPGDPVTPCSNYNYGHDTWPNTEKGNWRAQLEARGSHTDASCLAYHSDDTSLCYEKQHLLVHHVETPIFVAADLKDNVVWDNSPSYADVPGYMFTLTEYTKRIRDQAIDLEQNWSNEAREEGAGKPGGLILMHPSISEHVFLGGNDLYKDLMTYCKGGNKVTLSVAKAIIHWLAGDLPTMVIMENESKQDSYWVVGTDCSP